MFARTQGRVWKYLPSSGTDTQVRAYVRRSYGGLEDVDRKTRKPDGWTVGQLDGWMDE